MPALVLPGIGDVLVFYAPPLVVAQLLGAFARDEALTIGMLTPYVLTFTALWFAGEVVWRGAEALIARAEIRGIESLYVEAMDELLAKDLAFFHDNFAGSLTKRTLGYARRFEDVFDVFAFQVIAKIVPLAFVTVVLWRYSPLLIVVLLGMLSITVALVVPRIRRRRRLVDEREAASNVLAGHVADSIANAEAVRAFARERDEAAIHAANVRDFGRKTLRSWDYQNFRVNTITAPMYVLTNTLGLIVALHISLGTASSLETVFLTFSYFATATRVMWEFNRIYRNLEGALTDAAQFADLLLDPPSVSGRRLARSVRAARPQRRDARHQLQAFACAAAAVRSVLARRRGGDEARARRAVRRRQDHHHAAAAPIQGRRARRRSSSAASRSPTSPQSSLREAIAYVPQDPAMFHRTIADNIRFAPAARHRRRGPPRRGARARRGVHRVAARRLRHARGRARHQALRRPAPAHRDRARDPEGRADSHPRRGDELARLRERGAHSGRALDADGGAHRDRHRAPPLDRPAHGLARRPRPGPHRRAGNARQPARARRHLRVALVAPVGRVPAGDRRRDRRGVANLKGSPVLRST